MVGPMDGIELLNKTRVMASCRGDGTVLKPDRPVMTSDACFAARDSLCHISHTYSEVEQLNATVHYVFSSSATKLSDRHFDLDATTNRCVCVWVGGRGWDGRVCPTVSLVVAGSIRSFSAASTHSFGGVSASSSFLSTQPHHLQLVHEDLSTFGREHGA